MRKRAIAFLAAAFLIFPLAACGTQPSATAPAKGTYVKISASEAKTIMDAERGAIVVDVRTKEEFDASRIAGAILIPVTEIAALAPAMLPDKGAEILVYCRSGNRSATASQALIAMGYANVKDFGGIVDWPYGTVSGAQTAP